MKISVIIPTFNQDIFLSRCIRSLLKQSISKDLYEIIIVNDGSSDKTKFVIDLLKDPFSSNIKVINNKKNMGLPYSLNRGIKKSKGEFIVRVDSDDYVNKDFLYFLSIFLDMNPKINAVCCDYLLVDDQEVVLKRENSYQKPIACGIMFRKKTMQLIGLYDEKFLLNEEKEFRIRYESKFKIERLAIPLYRYRRHTNNITNDQKNMKKFDKLLKEKHFSRKNNP